MPGTGVVIDERIERLFRVAINTYLLKDRGASFPYAHRRFKDMYELYYPSEAESEIPTNWQMLHFYKREYNQVERITKRTSAIQYNKDVRPLKSTLPKLWVSIVQWLPILKIDRFIPMP
ncbi:MAG: hypothetical protein ACI9SP_002243 [Arenicella sp.]|jgi:hypothetical protein